MSDVPGLNPRREAREEALALLYQAELTSAPVDDALDARDVAPADYAVEIAQGVDDQRDELDALIGRHLTNWRVDRMPMVDRVLARMAAWELAERDDIPTGVVLAEAVELASIYCGEKSAPFLNGVLDSVAHEVRG
ncbi:MAG: transcription antitermination factor NusB [Actinomycetota bacterium]